ncbi:MAG: VWA domain-containing protein [Deltaproteobacteria bacterium]|nr:VWA domain-containing protein [Deltaproteobacteria bacterium]
MRFVTPELFYVACATPLLVIALHLYDRARRRHLTRQLGELPVIGKVIASASPGRRLLKDILAAVGLGLVVFAAARPQLEGKRKVELRGLDVVIAVDVSKSMLVDDVGPTAEMTRKKYETTRLARTRELATAVIDELPGDRVAPVVFAGAAAHFPLTEDHQVATRFLADLGPNDLPPGSNVAQVIRASRCLLRPDLYDDPRLQCSKIGRRGHGGDPLRGESLDPKELVEDEDKLEQKVERGKAIVIFTDGGEADAETVREVRIAGELGIALFLVGVGTTQGGVVYDVDPFSGKRSTNPKHDVNGNTVTSKRDDAGMRAIAEAGGDADRYLVAGERGEVDPMPIVEMLRAVNRGLATRQVKEMKDIYQPFLFIALMLFVIEAAIGTRRRRKYPEAA